MLRKNKFLLLILLFLISIGFAEFTINFDIINRVRINPNKWNIHLGDITVADGSVEVQYNIVDDTAIEFSANLLKPGDYLEFKVEVKNDGTADAMIKDVTNLVKYSSSSKKLPNYLEYSVALEDGKEVLKNQILEKENSVVYKVFVKFKDEIEPGTLFPDTETENFSLQFSVNYVPVNENAIPIK